MRKDEIQAEHRDEQTKALFAMSADQIREGGEEYKRLLEERDLKEFGYG